MSEMLTLYSYWRSSAAYRVRIALHLKGLAYAQKPVHLLNDGGEQRSAAYREINPQGLVPVLLDGERVIRQSLAIIEYLDESYPAVPLLPALARDRARVRGLAQLIACDIHPLNNLRVLQYLERELKMEQPGREAWAQHWMSEGLAAFEALAQDNPSTGDYCEGDIPTLADCCLIPQLYNARRVQLDLSLYPTLLRIETNCLQLQAFQQAAPERQPDAPQA
ncbi:maleylacetoacetate isomerase [Aquimonas sp.]|jgi:maleylacetoacetate isomerase|uniref:maleylacetoacetate isomerase n=1 Tax=Aquimonas sp. TaxID=1872588 RepID=UPI0037BF2777